ncbi:hypothetical protein SEVIR_9G278300v4 [Setaria viridis]|uniref:Uncharacterized protein n=2 Tax=Setaria TaxID=4554 RepID=K4AJB4_SETIT|nr:hypothetical protein SEVIR_9G278300v2 [Setaria viridis]
MASSASATQPDHHRTAITDRPRGAKHRRPLLNNLHIQVPAVPANSGWFGRPSGPATAPCGAHANANGHGHADRPASPSLLRSPSAWIRAKGHSFGSSKHTHRRSGNFHYDARSYAQNFDEGCDDEDAPMHQCFSPRNPTAPQLASPSSGL